MKKITKIVIYIILGLAVLILGLICLSKYAEWKFDREMELLKIEQEKPYLEDTYGGATPKETLDLFIAAVAKEDFDLASRYFVVSRQGEWKNKLNNGNKDNLKVWVNLLRKAQDRDFLGENNFQMYVKDKNIDNLIINFVKYPKGIWKIEEI